MARLNDRLDSDDELPELSSILAFRTEATITTPPKTAKQKSGEIQSPKKWTQNSAKKNLVTKRHANAPGTLVEVSTGKQQSRKQRSLQHFKQAHVNSLLFPVSGASIRTSKSEGNQRIAAVDRLSIEANPRKLANGAADYSRLAQVSAKSVELAHHDDDCSYTDVFAFIVPDSASDGETSRLPKKKEKKSRSLNNCTQEAGFQVSRQPLTNTRQPSGTNDVILPGEKKENTKNLESLPSNEPSRSELHDAHPNLDDRLTFFSSRLRSPYESEDNYHTLTPPSSPLISKLKSPSKRHRIPPSPHRPSIDAFWSQDVINDWNEQYSPKKILMLPQKYQIHSVDDDEELPPSESPHRSPLKSSAKMEKKMIEQRKLFNGRKDKLARAFLAEVDQTITNGQIASMADSTGGIKLIWSKKLSSTAGRANWKREVLHSKNADGSVSNTTHRHHASIELAEKVIDDEDRLINVIAHEYCHLANFMISGIKNNPHGKDFKEWAGKCTNAFAHRAIKVTTKHAYSIAYKYIWACVWPSCGLEYKRHSKSIDPSKYSCGNCKGELVQVQPVPRKGVSEGKRTGYQEFVKRENERVRHENPGASFGEIMSIIGRDFKERKKNKAESVDGRKAHGAFEEIDSNESGYLDSAVRKLDFLVLGS